jgi:hypothetical protein
MGIRMNKVAKYLSSDNKPGCTDKGQPGLLFTYTEILVNSMILGGRALVIVPVPAVGGIDSEYTRDTGGIDNEDHSTTAGSCYEYDCAS